MGESESQLATLLSISEAFLAPSSLEIDYQKITDDLLELSGGKYAVLNIINGNDPGFQTMAVSGLGEQVQKAASILGFELRGKKWPHNGQVASSIRNATITRFASLSDLAPSGLAKPSVSLLEKLFGLGEVIVAKVAAGERILGHFGILMPAGVAFTGDSVVSVYVRLLGIFLLRREAEARQQRNEERVRAVEEHSRTVTWEVDMEGLYTYVSPSARQLLGYSPEEMQGHLHFYDLHPEEGREAFKTAALEAFRRHESFVDLEISQQAKDGRILWVSTNGLPLLDETGTLTGYRGSDSDISRRRQAEIDLHESDLRYGLLFENSMDAVLLTWPDGRIESANQAALRMFGISETEFQQRGRSGIMDITDPRLRPALEERARNGHFSGELTGLRSDGSTFPLEISTSLYQDGRGAARSGMTIRDITERKQAERDLTEANHQLEEAVATATHYSEQAEMATAAKSEFLANMSHEIRTPMNGVVGAAGLLLDTDLDEGQRRYAEIVHSSGEALLTLINDILDFSKMEAGKLDLEILDFNVRRLVNDLVMSMALRAHSKGLELHSTIDQDVPGLLCGDPGRLRQILTNLVGNAVKFTKEGEVALRVSLMKPGGTQAAGSASGDIELRFSIRDTGIGIAPEKTGQLFSKFAQADASTTRQFGGTGLGLAISKQLAELMGGEIGVESSLDQGSEFWFTVRLQSQAEGPSGPSGENAESGPTQAIITNRSTGHLAPPVAGPARLLLVEDNPTNQVIAQAMLNKLGLHADIASNGQEALVALEYKRYDLVFMDVMMPRMDGLEATRRIRDPGSAVLDHAVPIVAMTANAMKGDRDRCLDAGMDDYVSKPILPEVLSAIVLRWLSKEGRQDQKSPPDGTAAQPGQLEKESPVVFDRNDMARRFQHDEGLIKDLLSYFLEDILVQIKTLFEHLETGDLPAAELRAHTIKGAAANIGAQVLLSVADTLETCARKGDLPAMRRHMGELELQCERLREQLEKEISAGSY